jgi:hypothetical protein
MMSSLPKASTATRKKPAKDENVNQNLLFLLLDTSYLPPTPILKFALLGFLSMLDFLQNLSASAIKKRKNTSSSNSDGIPPCPDEIEWKKSSAHEFMH